MYVVSIIFGNYKENNGWDNAVIGHAFSDAQLLLCSGSCRITVTGSNLNVSHTTKFLMSSGVDSFTLNVILAEQLLLSF